MHSPAFASAACSPNGLSAAKAPTIQHEIDVGTLALSEAAGSSLRGRSRGAIGRFNPLPPFLWCRRPCSVLVDELGWPSTKVETEFV